MLSAAKDRMTSAAVRAFLEARIKSYGRIDALSIDSKRQRIELTVQLTGEVSPITVTIVRYTIEKQGGNAFIEVLESAASRPWLEAVMRDHLHGRKFEVPSWAAAAL